MLVAARGWDGAGAKWARLQAAFIARVGQQKFPLAPAHDAQELSTEEIRVNAIAPGAIRTSINKSAWETEAAERSLLEHIPYGRIGDQDDVAQAALWLASDLSDYVVGTTLFIDGGMLLCPAFREGG